MKRIFRGGPRVKHVPFLNNLTRVPIDAGLKNILSLLLNFKNRFLCCFVHSTVVFDELRIMYNWELEQKSCSASFLSVDFTFELRNNRCLNWEITFNINILNTDLIILDWKWFEKDSNLKIRSINSMESNFVRSSSF